MKIVLVKNNVLIFLLLLSTSITGFSQDEPDFREEMIESGERHEVPEEVKSSSSDYTSFLKSKLINTSQTGNTIFVNPKELGISVIGGRVRASIVDKTNQIYLVAPSGGGLWKFNAITNDDFTPVNDLGSFLAITDIAQDPLNPQHILIGTGDRLHGMPGNGLFESFNGGNIFTKITSVEPNSNSDFKYIRFVKFSPDDNKIIYLATNYKLYKSSDSGTNWTEVFYSSNCPIQSLDILAEKSVIIGVDYKGIYISTDGNAGSFKLVTTDLPNDATASNGLINGVVAATHAANRNIAYAFFTGSSNDVYKSEDNGITWSLLAKPDFYIGQTTFCLTIGIHPVNPDIVVLGSITWGYTTDGGSTWHRGIGLEVDFHSVHFHESDPDVAYLGYDQGLGRVDFNKYVDYWVWDGSQYVIEKQPEQLQIGKNEKFNTSQVYYGDYFPEEYGDGYLQGQQDGGCFGQVNNVDARIVVGDGGSVFVNKQNPLKAFASTQMGNLYSTSSAIPPKYNYSRIGSFYNNHPNWITQFDGNNADGSQIYISDLTSIQGTNDGGSTFKSIATHALNYVKIAVQDTADPTVHAVGYNPSNGKLDLITIKQAATNPATSIKNDILSNYYGSADHIEIDPNDVNTVFLTTNSGAAFKIAEINTGSFNVKSIKGDADYVVFNTVIGIKNKPEMLIAGTNIGLFYSTNSGANWILSNELPYTQITDLKLRESDNRLFVFTYGRGSWAVTVNTDPDLIHTISANVFPPNSGIVTGTGQFKNYSNVVLEAISVSDNRFLNWTENDIILSTSENYEFAATKSRNLIANFEIAQKIALKSGWNIFSSGLIPQVKDIKSVSQSLIDRHSLLKIQDESGNSLEDWGVFGGWQNNIGDISPGDGYKIKVNVKDTLTVYGIPVKYPYAIPLYSGWNIVGYPQQNESNGMDIVQPLLEKSTLIKVQDEQGNSIEDWGIFGGWTNGIGDFLPGEGYKLKVNAKDTLWIYDSFPKSTTLLPEQIATTHFTPKFEGNGVDHMNINLVCLPINILKPGDELAVFDGETCVGAVTLMPHHLQSQTVSIAASANDNQGMNGFEEGDQITLKLYSMKTNQEYIIEPEILKGTPTFTKQETILANLEKYTTTVFEGLAGGGLHEINCYPNPFSNTMTIEINLAEDSQVQVEVLNQLGQQVRFLLNKQLLNGGLHNLNWNGRNENNQVISQGIYLLKIIIGELVVHKKIILSY